MAESFNNDQLNTPIKKGDGSMQKRLDAGRCPKCGTALAYQLAPDTGWQKCSTCGLQVSQ